MNTPGMPASENIGSNSSIKPINCLKFLVKCIYYVFMVVFKITYGSFYFFKQFKSKKYALIMIIFSYSLYYHHLSYYLPSNVNDNNSKYYKALKSVGLSV